MRRSPIRISPGSFDGATRKETLYSSFSESLSWWSEGAEFLATILPPREPGWGLFPRGIKPIQRRAKLGNGRDQWHGDSSSQTRRWLLVFPGTSPTLSDFVQRPVVNNKCKTGGFLYGDWDLTDNVRLHYGMSSSKQLYEVNMPRAVFHILQMRCQGTEGSNALQKVTQLTNGGTGAINLVLWLQLGVLPTFHPCLN